MRTLQAEPGYVDTAGAGDWYCWDTECLGATRSEGLHPDRGSKVAFRDLSRPSSGSMELRFRGARGGMYSVSTDEFRQTTPDDGQGAGHLMPDEDEPKKVLGKVVPRVCSECRASAKTQTGRPLLRPASRIVLQGRRRNCLITPSPQVPFAGGRSVSRSGSGLNSAREGQVEWSRTTDENTRRGGEGRETGYQSQRSGPQGRTVFSNLQLEKQLENRLFGEPPLYWSSGTAAQVDTSVSEPVIYPKHFAGTCPPEVSGLRSAPPGCNMNPQGSCWRPRIPLRNLRFLRLTGARS